MSHCETVGVSNRQLTTEATGLSLGSPLRENGQVKGVVVVIGRSVENYTMVDRASFSSTFLRKAGSFLYSTEFMSRFICSRDS